MNRHQRRALQLQAQTQAAPGPQAHCHKLVAQVAKEAAGELYGTLMEDNALFKEWKRQNPGVSAKALELRFVARNWGKCLHFARATLARMLESPINEILKEEILEALILDNTLIKGRVGREALAPGLHNGDTT